MIRVVVLPYWHTSAKQRKFEEVEARGGGWFRTSLPFYLRIHFLRLPFSTRPHSLSLSLKLSLSTCTYLLYLHNIITHKQSILFFSVSQPCRYNQYLTSRNYYSPMSTLVTTLLQCFPPATGSCLSISSVSVVNRSVLVEESDPPLLH